MAQHEVLRCDGQICNMRMMGLMYDLIEMKVGSVMLPRWYERREALTGHVRVRFGSDVYDGADVT